MTILTRGKKPVTFQIPDDSDSSYAKFKDAIKHVAADRTDEAAVKSALEGKNFDGAVNMHKSCVSRLACGL